MGCREILHQLTHCSVVVQGYHDVCSTSNGSLVLWIDGGEREEIEIGAWLQAGELAGNEPFCEVPQIVEVRLGVSLVGVIAGILKPNGKNRLRRTSDVVLASCDLAEQLECAFNARVRPGNLVGHPFVVHFWTRLLQVNLGNPVSGGPATGRTVLHAHRPEILSTRGNLV